MTSDFGFVDEREARRVFSRSFLALTVYSIAGVGLITLLQTVLLIVMGAESAQAFFGNIYVQWGLQVVIMYAVAYPLFLLALKGVKPVRLEKSKLSLEEFTILFLISQAVMVIGNLISTFITDRLSDVFGYEIENSTAELIYETPVWLIILVAVIIGPVFEELIFRKALIDRLSVYGDRLAIVISSVAFGVFHGNLSQLLYATGIGLVLGYIYVKTRDVKYTCLIHVLMNFLGSSTVIFARDEMQRMEALDPEAIPGAEQSLTIMQDSLTIFGLIILQYGLAIAGAVLLIIWIDKKKFRLPKRDGIIEIPDEAVFRVSTLNVGAILFGLICLGEIILSLLPA